MNGFQFILRLEKLASAAKSDSSFTVTLKRFNGHDRPVPREGKPPLPKPEEYMCLMRVHSKSKKISTVVRREDVPKMVTMYAQFMRSNLDGLKRVKKVKSKAKAAKG
uniref:Signal recognition particle 14 kDa protein n=2 Tax=Glossina TaxID=44049 RepID=A0A1A9ULZ5_GLOAU